MPSYRLVPPSRRVPCRSFPHSSVNRRRRVLLLVLGALSLTGRASASYFRSLGFAPGTNSSFATAVSADGTTVVGNTQVAGNSPSERAFRWTAGTGLVTLTGMSGGASATAVSGNGAVVVGFAGSNAFRWNAAEGMVPFAMGAAPQTGAFGVSADGSIITGNLQQTSGGVQTSTVFRWTSGTGVVNLGGVPGAPISTATGCSADGSIIVGGGRTASGPIQGFRWTAGTGMQGLGASSSGGWTLANAVSGDGNNIVGYAQTAQGLEAFSWTQATGMTGLGDLPGGSYYSNALAVSGDGSVVVGLWHGLCRFQSVLLEQCNGI